MQKYLFGFLMICVSNIMHAQHLPIYSMYMFNGLVINPAKAGSNGALTAMLHYRNQWSAFAGNPTTYTLAVDSPLKKDKFNLGAVFSFDKFGITGRTDYLQSFCYRQSITSKSQIAVGIQAGFTYQRFNWSELDAPPEDQAFANNPKSNFFPKLGIGLNYTINKLYVGASVPHFSFANANDGTFSYFNKPVYYFTSGLVLEVSNSLSITPSLLYKYMQNSPSQLDLNAMATYKNLFSLGASYRTGNAFIFLMEFKLNQLKFGYAYDYFLNSLKSVSKGSHELMLKYEFRYVVKVTDPRNFY